MNAPLSPERIGHLLRDWVQIFERLAIESQSALPLFDDLVARYAEPHRHYHNLQHIADVLETAEKLIDLAATPEAVRLAIWYHDAIYDTRAKDSEERSAQLATESLRSIGVDAQLIEKTAALIRATAHALEAPADIDADIVLDADLSILAADEERYARYAGAIRREFAWVDESAYRAGRSQVLHTFLNRPRIFRTGRMFEACEAAARTNIARELKSLC